MAPAKDFPTLLRERMDRRDGMTGVDVARLLGVSQPTVSKWRNGRELPKPENVPVVADFLGITEERLAALLHEGRLKRSGTTTSPASAGLRPKDLDRMIETLDRELAAGVADPERVAEIRDQLAGQRAAFEDRRRHRR